MLIKITNQIGIFLTVTICHTSHGQATAIKGFNNLVDHSVRGEGDFNEQERRTLENATHRYF
jgi:hypothetical protein